MGLTDIMQEMQDYL